jgi:hypothetical protein
MRTKTIAPVWKASKAAAVRTSVEISKPSSIHNRGRECALTLSRTNNPEILMELQDSERRS